MPPLHFTNIGGSKTTHTLLPHFELSKVGQNSLPKDEFLRCFTDNSNVFTMKIHSLNRFWTFTEQISKKKTNQQKFDLHTKTLGRKKESNMHRKIVRAFRVDDIAKGAKTQRNITSICKALHNIGSHRHSVPVENIKCQRCTPIKMHFWTINVDQISPLSV